SSDGNYWLALVGMRTPTFDLALTMPAFRKRMVRRIAPDEWMFPNINSGCVLKFNEAGEILDVLWDLGGQNHPMITSMREHKGHLYLGGVSNNRIGRLKLNNADPDWTGNNSYWRKK
ncbi:MAG: ABC transporter permease, partial [Rhizobiales bacterium]|nr:ABC transporter permease [Hyphomicrobiales bacterium]